jgi:prepilin-type N-terminal cleavage/methylation domain-containing protein
MRGVTLIEMLVSMLILGAVMSLVAQAVSQVERIVRAADETHRAMSERWGGGWAVQMLFANVVAPSEAGDRAFDGESTRVRAYSTLSPLDEEGGVRGFELTLRPSAQDARSTEVLYFEPDERGGRKTEPQPVARLEAAAVFRFASADGVLSEHWPGTVGPLGSKPPKLPAAIQIVSSDGARLLMSFPVPAHGAAQPGESKSPFAYGRP